MHCIANTKTVTLSLLAFSQFYDFATQSWGHLYGQRMNFDKSSDINVLNVRVFFCPTRKDKTHRGNDVRKDKLMPYLCMGGKSTHSTDGGVLSMYSHDVCRYENLR